MIKQLPEDNLLPPGEYFVGDLAQVLPNEIEEEVIQLGIKEGGLYKTKSGVAFFICSSQIGDGLFYDTGMDETNGSVCVVDSGTIGVWPTNAIANDIDLDYGSVYFFDDDFACFYCEKDEIIKIDFIEISTNSEVQFNLRQQEIQVINNEKQINEQKERTAMAEKALRKRKNKYQ